MKSHTVNAKSFTGFTFPQLKHVADAGKNSSSRCLAAEELKRRRKILDKWRSPHLATDFELSALTHKYAH